VPLPPSNKVTSFDMQMMHLEADVRLYEKLIRLTAALPLRQPLEGSLDVTSVFGGRTDPFTGRLALHTGIDFRGEYGEEVYATAEGTVTTADLNGGYGNMVEIDHGHGVSTRYAHLSAIRIAIGQHVSAGTLIGLIGSTGRSTGPHLHYEVR